MITKGDDFPLHQTPEPIAYTGATRNFYDRYFFNGYHLSEDVFFAAALGVYPYVNVMDAAFNVIIDGVQHNLLASKTLHMERMDTEVGPVAIDVVQPLRQLRVTVQDTERDIHADLLFSARAEVQEEPRFTRRIGSQLVMDSTRMTQNGVWEGWIEVQGRRIEVSPEQWQGTRDRSWGVRNIGMADPQPNPLAPPSFQFYWLWAPINWGDCITLYHLNDDELGRPWNTAGVMVPLLGQGDAEEMAQVSSKMTYKAGTRHARHTTIEYQRKNGGIVQIDMQPRFHWYMKGVGYGHPEFNHGSFHGELDTYYDCYNLSEIDDASNLHIQALCDVRMSGDFGEKQGRGVLEQLIIGPHAPSGFKELMDMAQ